MSSSLSTPTVPAPVEFDPYSDVFFDSPFETYRRMRDEAPVYYNPKYDFYALTRYDDVASAYKDTATYSSAHGASLDQVKSDEMHVRDLKLIIMMDPPEHERMRKLISRAFTPRVIAALESTVRQQISQTLAVLNPKSFDAVADFSALFPVEIITAMLGVPPEDRQQVRQWIDLGLEREPGNMGLTQESMDAILQTGAYYYHLVQERRARPREDMISRLIEAEIDDGGKTRSLDDVEIAGFASLLGGAGAETVTKLVGNAVVIFAEHTEQWQLLRRDRTKIGAAVEELLRYEGPSQYNVRYTLRESTLHDTTIPAGSAVLLINGSANRDERAFPDPDRFDINRRRKFGYNIGFGYGVHSCLGAALARLESRIALEMLLDFIPRYEVDRAGLRRVHMTNVWGWSNVPVHAP
ncbi:cytochrome P450 [Mycobacterium bourgelatii]|uniref:Cytochrome P450 n=1 Tax=Mycobacterium bourgelatii TaxID=1273442 RepID=A0A7I9YL14_MYCBU|nr:cytochrome P450 [Mycobacterium bourgelatii]GFG89262.1 cytochrome P450 [Mycobacterium bourgelatii]